MAEIKNALEIEDLYDDEGMPNACPGCELVAIRAAVAEARERWADIFQMSKDTEDRTVREALATALHYMEVACEHGGARHENAPDDAVAHCDEMPGGEG